MMRFLHFSDTGRVRVFEDVFFFFFSLFDIIWVYIPFKNLHTYVKLF